MQWLEAVHYKSYVKDSTNSREASYYVVLYTSKCYNVGSCAVKKTSPCYYLIRFIGLLLITSNLKRGIPGCSIGYNG